MLIAYNRYRAQEYHHKFSATDNAYPTPRSWTASHQVLGLCRKLSNANAPGA